MIPLIIIISLINVFEPKLVDIWSFKDLQEKINNLPDSHLDLEQDYTFNPDVDKIESIKINKPLTINGQNHTINGLKQSKIFEISETEVVLTNINFINGFSKDFGGVINLINSSLDIINCSFSNNNAYLNGGAIYLYNSSMNLSESIFKFNNAKKLYATGGGISAENSIINIEKSTFFDNSADEGGAIYSINSILEILTSTFYNNNAEWYGGAIVSDSQLSIYDSNFNNNKAGYKGGSIHTTISEFSKESFLIINNTLIFNNEAEYGGAISSSNLEYIHIFNSEIYDNIASFGSVISRMSSNSIEMINCSCYNNKANNGSILYSLSGGNNSFINDTFTNNKAIIGGLIFTLSGRIDAQKTNFSSNFINCNLKDNSGNKGLIYSIYDDLIIENSSITFSNKCYNVPIIYKIMSGEVIEHNNWWGEINPDLSKLIIYEYEKNLNTINLNINNNHDFSEGCSSSMIQIDDKNSGFTFRRDSTHGVNVDIIYQKNGILQFKSDPDFFWHGIISKDGWIVGNGGEDTPHSCEKLEAYAKIMIKNNNIIDELIENAFKIKSLNTLGHFFIKAPNGTYGLVIYIIKEKKVRIEKGKLNSGEYIISPNDNAFYKKGKISDLKINENYTYISRYLAAIDQYSSYRTNDFTYNFVTTDKSKYVDIFVANDDGSLAHKKNDTYLFNDIYINDKYILGEKVPIIMNGMYLDRYLIERQDDDDDGGKDNKMINIKININSLIFILGILVLY